MPRTHADIVVGLGWGDEGKGATVDALAAQHRPNRVVRFNGGNQAGHNVAVGDVHHTFSTFGSATLLGVPTWIAGYCTIEPVAAAREAEVLASHGLNAHAYVDAGCLLTTPLHALANRAREAARGVDRHGSTGIGFGETVGYGLDNPDDAPRAADLTAVGVLTQKMEALHAHYLAEGTLTSDDLTHDQLRIMARSQAQAARGVFTLVDADALLEEIASGYSVFEGAQGLWLDENFGAQPHTTWSTTTPANARRLLRAAGVDDVRAIGCVRTYATRHGAGPLPGENQLPFTPPEPDNTDASFAGTFRTGAIDPRMLREAIHLTAVDTLAVNHVDAFDGFVTTQGPLPLDEFGPVAVLGYGPSRTDRVWRDHESAGSTISLASRRFSAVS